MNYGDWKVHIEPDWMRVDGARLYVYRNVGRNVELLTGWSDVDSMEPVFTTHQEGDTPDSAIRLPLSALKAIAEHFKPGPDQGEVKRLTEALQLERARVDYVLGRK